MEEKDLDDLFACIPEGAFVVDDRCEDGVEIEQIDEKNLDELFASIPESAFCVRNSMESNDLAIASEKVLDESCTSVPKSVLQLDERYKYYANAERFFNNPSSVVKIFHRDDKFEFSVPIGDIQQSGLYLVGEFEEDVLVTRIGLTAVQSFFEKPEVQIDILVRKGSTVSTKETVRALQHWQIPPMNITTCAKDLFVDFGRSVHIRAHSDYALEARVTLRGQVVVKNLSVFIRVQSPERVGGIYDHASWVYDQQHLGLPIKSPRKYLKYFNDGEDLAGRRLRWWDYIQPHNIRTLQLHTSNVYVHPPCTLLYSIMACTQFLYATSNLKFTWV